MFGINVNKLLYVYDYKVFGIHVEKSLIPSLKFLNLGRTPWEFKGSGLEILVKYDEQSYICVLFRRSIRRTENGL